MSAPRPHSERLTEALRALARAKRETPSPPPGQPLTLLEVGLRLSALEREVGEVRSRVNGVLFAVVASVLAQFVAKLVG